MSCVQDQVRCAQCENPEADFDFSNYREVTICPRCGYSESWSPQYDDGVCCGWKHEIHNGAGALGYRLKAKLHLTFLASGHGRKFFARNGGCRDD
jgi:hypothetical protein